MNATVKQIDLLIRLWTRSGQLREKAEDAAKAANRACTPLYVKDFENWAREGLALKSVADLDAAIKAAHARLNWDARTAPASSAQRIYIRDLERQILGRVETIVGSPLTYAEADQRIRYLKLSRPEVPGMVRGEELDDAERDVLG